MTNMIYCTMECMFELETAACAIHSSISKIKRLQSDTHSADSSSEIFQSHKLRQPALDLPVDRHFTSRVFQECPEFLQTIEMTCKRKQTCLQAMNTFLVVVY